MTDLTPVLDHERPTAPSLFGRVEVLPGQGLVLRRGGLLLVVPTVDGSQQDLLAELVGLCTHHGAPGGEDVLRLLGDLVSGSGSSRVPAFACLAAQGDHVHVMAYGAVQVAVDDQDPGSFTGARTGAWVQRSLPATFSSLSVRGTDAPDDTDEIDDTDEAGPHAGPGALLLDLLDGQVPGAGVTLHRPGVEATPGVGRASTGTDTPPGGRAMTVLRTAPRAHVVSLAPRAPDPARARSPLPVGGASPAVSPPFGSTPATSAPGPPTPVLVSGIVCRCGAFNSPDLEECQACGAPLDRDGPRETRPRPPLGILITDDGRVFTVTDDVVLGREPGQAPEVSSGRARPVVLRDREQSTSRVHAEIRLSGWRVAVVDRGSANGTYVSRSGSAGPWVLVPSDPGVPLAPGDRLRLGRREVLFDRYQLS
ncbi:FHA domain-containing protein [Pedococcus sp. 2YAF34]|uniref:FHA domain-containing protein n=1 Tax=Pedococcus sp. 2YAF34 TaxID=3233032 RepID=UPI003F975396